MIDASTIGTFDTQNYAVKFSGLISGAGTLDKVGIGTLTLSHTNTFGGLELSAGVLNYGILGAGAGTVDFTGNATLQDGVLSAGTLANNIVIDPSKTGTFDTQGYTATLSGAISGLGTLDKAGTGLLTLLERRQ